MVIKSRRCYYIECDKCNAVFTRDDSEVIEELFVTKSKALKTLREDEYWELKKGKFSCGSCGEGK